MQSRLNLIIVVFFSPVFMAPILVFAQQANTDQIFFKETAYPLFPETLVELPQIPSPFTSENGTEVLVVFTRSGQYALVPVTVENGRPLLYSRRVGTQFGKDNQLLVDSGDFPTLAKTGLHSDSELEGKNIITGYPISMISYIGRPGRFSGTGFMAGDEDIISVLKGDNQLVKQMGLTHPQMARPLFQVWNLILEELETGTMKRYPSIQHLYYNGRIVNITAEGGKGWQVSIFQDEIQGRFNIQVSRKMSVEETSFLSDMYPGLKSDQIQVLIEKLSSIRFSEMAPYYIMRYGFYEGHTDFRSDPIALTYIFGLRSLEEIANTFQVDLHQTLTRHFSN